MPTWPPKPKKKILDSYKPITKQTCQNSGDSETHKLTPDAKLLPKTDHLVLHYPEIKLEGDYDTINRCDEDFQAWVNALK